MAQAEPGGDARPVAAVVRPQPLAERLERLEARAGASRVDADALVALFLTSAGQRMASAGALEVLLRRLGARVGGKKVFPHRFRHTFATWAIESGAREIYVQMLLGHSDLTMTQRYARAYTSEQAVRAHAELSRVARLNAASP